MHLLHFFAFNLTDFSGYMRTESWSRSTISHFTLLAATASASSKIETELH